MTVHHDRSPKTNATAGKECVPATAAASKAVSAEPSAASQEMASEGAGGAIGGAKKAGPEAVRATIPELAKPKEVPMSGTLRLKS